MHQHEVVPNAEHRNDLVGVWGQMALTDAAVRVGMHVHTFGQALKRSRSRRERNVRLAAAAVTLGADAWRIIRVSTPRARHRGVGQALDAGITAWWATATSDDTLSIRAPVMAPSFPNALGEGFLLGAGRRGLPVIPGARVWPPADRSDVLWRVARLGAAALGPWLATAAVRRARDQRVGWGESQWGVLAGGMGILIARVRAHQQAHLGRRWAERTTIEVERAAAQARYESVAVAGPRHDLGRVMWGISVGTDSALELAAQARMGLPTAIDLSEPFARRPLGAVLTGRELEPEAAKGWWVTSHQAEEVLRFLNDADATFDEFLASDQAHAQGDEADLIWAEEVRLDRSTDGTLTVEYRGLRLRMRANRDQVESWRDVAFGLDPIAVGLLATGLVKGMAWSPDLGGAPLRFALGAAACDALAAGVLVLQFPDRDSNPLWVTAAAGAGCALWMVGVARGKTRELTQAGTTPVYAATLGTSVLGVVGHYARELPWRSRTGIIVTVAGTWAALMSRRRQPVPFADWVTEAAVMAQYAIALWGFSTKVDAERASVDVALEAELEARIAFESARARLKEHHRARRDVAHTREVLHRANAHPDFTPQDIAHFDDMLRRIEDQLDQDEASDNQVIDETLRRLAASPTTLPEPRTVPEEVRGLLRALRRSPGSA